MLDEKRAVLLDYIEKCQFELSPETILDAARTVTGFDEFGRDEFYRRLESYINEMPGRPERTEFCRLLKHVGCYKFACTRLRFEDFAANHPEIYQENINNPIIIVGPGRSGTMYLQRILATDPRFNYVTYPGWRSEFPEGNNFEPPLFELLKRFFEHEIAQDLTSLLNSNTPKPKRKFDPIEDISILLPDFPVGLMEFRDPFSAGKYLDYDHTPHYEYMKVVLQALQWLHGKKTWVLKDPSHCLQLPALMNVFPDAVIVVTHRDPLATITSIATKFAPAVKMYYRETGIDELARYCIDRNKLTRRAIVRDSHNVPERQLVNVLFHELASNSLGTVERIYDCAQLEFSKEDRQRVSKYISETVDYNQNSEKFDITRDFSINPDDVRNEFAFYYESYPVEIEYV